MKPAETLQKVCRACEALAKAAEPYHGLIPSMLDLKTHEMLTESPPPIEGQRQGDRAPLGSNLMHDQVSLRTMLALGREDLTAAVDAYLTRFAAHCTETETGLFPWGEHAFWHLTEDRVGSGHDPTGERPVHDHLRAVPSWLWREIHERNPRCVERFAEGLDYHWRAGEPREYCRHAPIRHCVHEQRGARSCDFPRHGGFYMVDWAFALSRTDRPDFLEQIRRMADDWWPRRDEDGLLLIESRTPSDDDRFHNVNAPGQTISLALSLLEAADYVEVYDDRLAETMRDRSAVYRDGFFAAPHDPANGVFVILCRRGSGEITRLMPVWGSVYGVWPASYVALTCLATYRWTGDDRLLQWAKGAGRCYAQEPMPEGVNAPAMDAGMGLGLLADLYAVTGEKRWLTVAQRLADRVCDVYLDSVIPRGAAGIDWYESQMGPGFVLHALARTAMLAMDSGACPLDADYTGR